MPADLWDFAQNSCERDCRRQTAVHAPWKGAEDSQESRNRFARNHADKRDIVVGIPQAPRRPTFCVRSTTQGKASRDTVAMTVKIENPVAGLLGKTF